MLLLSPSSSILTRCIRLLIVITDYPHWLSCHYYCCAAIYTTTHTPPSSTTLMILVGRNAANNRMSIEVNDILMRRTDGFATKELRCKCRAAMPLNLKLRFPLGVSFVSAKHFFASCFQTDHSKPWKMDGISSAPWFSLYMCRKLLLLVQNYKLYSAVVY